LISASGDTSAIRSETPRCASAATAAAGSSPSFNSTGASAKCWLRNLPVVLLSSIASSAPARPSLPAGTSSSEIADFACGWCR